MASIVAKTSRSRDDCRCSGNERDLENSAIGRRAFDKTASMAVPDATVSIMSGSPADDWTDSADVEIEKSDFGRVLDDPLGIIGEEEKKPFQLWHPDKIRIFH